MIAESLRKLNTFTPQMYLHDTCVVAHSVRPQLCQDIRQTQFDNVGLQWIRMRSSVKGISVRVNACLVLQYLPRSTCQSGDT